MSTCDFALHRYLSPLVRYLPYFKLPCRLQHYNWSGLMICWFYSLHLTVVCLWKEHWQPFPPRNGGCMPYTFYEWLGYMARALNWNKERCLCMCTNVKSIPECARFNGLHCAANYKHIQDRCEWCELVGQSKYMNMACTTVSWYLVVQLRFS